MWNLFHFYYSDRQSTERGLGERSRYSNSNTGSMVKGASQSGVRISAPIQTKHGAHPASYTIGTGSFLGFKWPGHGIDNPPPPSVKAKGRAQLYLYSPSGPSWLVLRWTLPSPFLPTEQDRAQHWTNLIENIIMSSLMTAKVVSYPLIYKTE